MLYIYPNFPSLLTGIDEISEDVYTGGDHSDSEDSDKSDSSDSEYASDEEQKPKGGQHTEANDKGEKDTSKRGSKDPLPPIQNKEGKTEGPGPATATATMGDAGVPSTLSESLSKEKQGVVSDKEPPEKAKAVPASLAPREKPQVKQEARQTSLVDDSDSERELVIDLGEDQGGRDRKRTRKDAHASKDPPTNKTEGESPPILYHYLTKIIDAIIN